MYYCTFMRMKECFDALMLLMSIGSQDMHGCTTNEDWRDGQGIKQMLNFYMKMLFRP